jgi:hypothetical protein
VSYTTNDTTPAPASGARSVDIVRHRFSGAKDGFKTSEFYVMVAFVAAVLFATYLDADSLGREDGWRFAVFAVVAYIISRGLAKLGVRHDTPPTTRSKSGFITAKPPHSPVPSQGNGAAAYTEFFASRTQRSVAWQVAHHDLQRYVTWRETSFGV